MQLYVRLWWHWLGIDGADIGMVGCWSMGVALGGVLVKHRVCPCGSSHMPTGNMPVAVGVVIDHQVDTAAVVDRQACYTQSAVDKLWIT